MIHHQAVSTPEPRASHRQVITGPLVAVAFCHLILFYSKLQGQGTSGASLASEGSI